MPAYLTDVLGFNLAAAGVLAMFPYIALYISTLASARIFDYLQREKGWTVRTVRYTAMLIAIVGASGALVICSFLDNKYAAYCLMIVCQVRI